MSKHNKVYWTLGMLGSAAVVAGGVTYMRFRRDLQKACARLDALEHEVIDTSEGPVEVAFWGEGKYPVLSVHGIMGGYDQGLMLAKGWLDSERFRVIAPSRFGYLGTPMPEGTALPSAQADAFAALLDALGIKRTGVVAASAGGTSALQFAMCYPDRCTGLVLVSSNAPSDADFTMPPRPVMERVFGSDFLFWMLTTHFRKQLRPMLGVPRDYTLTREDLAAVNEAMNTLLPVSPRATGAVHDAYVSNPDINNDYPLDSLTVPVLVIGAVDDPLAEYENLTTMAERMPNARLLTVAEGGHMLLGDDGQVPAKIQAFLSEMALQRP